MEEARDNPLQEQSKVHGFTVDLVRKLTVENDSPAKVVEHEGEIELSLGLSSNGKFGVDPKRSQVNLFRASSSMSTFTLNCDDNQEHEVQFGVDAPPLIRTCSLPNVIEEEEEEELRKRKALQLSRRVEAKKRRMEKMMYAKEGREKVDNVCIKNCSGQGFVCSNGDGAMPLLIQGSEHGSQGNGSSDISESESNSFQVRLITDSLTNVAKAPLSNHSQLPETGRNLINDIRSGQRHMISDHKPPIAPRTVSVVDKPTSVVGEEEDKKRRKEMEGLGKKMPFVTTLGKGPNGKRIQGLLYQYKKGDEVKIVCVCHGSVFSPAQFVRHAGGVEFDNPLRHILVTTPPFF